MSQIHSVQSQVKAGRTLVDKAFSENLSALVLLTALEGARFSVDDTDDYPDERATLYSSRATRFRSSLSGTTYSRRRTNQR